MIVKGLRRRVSGWIERRRTGPGFLRSESAAFDSLFVSRAKVERVATGFRFTEGPVWFCEERCLLFSDIPETRIFKLTRNGRLATFRQPSGHSNGLTRDRERRLIACEHGNRRVTRTEKNGSISVLAEVFQGKKLNTPNDVVVKSDGCVYFTDPPYGIKPEQQEQPIQGVYRLSPDGRESSIVADDFEKPNGLTFSPDEKKLYINDSSRRHIRVFDVASDGFLSHPRLFHDMNVDEPGSPDGMKVDVAGRVYCAGPEGVWVFDKKGAHLGTIVTPEKPANCAWGGDDWRSLSISARTSVYKIQLNSPASRCPRSPQNRKVAFGDDAGTRF
jgi:gluconolactonase